MHTQAMRMNIGLTRPQQSALCDGEVSQFLRTPRVTADASIAAAIDAFRRVGFQGRVLIGHYAAVLREAPAAAADVHRQYAAAQEDPRVTVEEFTRSVLDRTDAHMRFLHGRLLRNIEENAGEIDESVHMLVQSMGFTFREHAGAILRAGALLEALSPRDIASLELAHLQDMHMVGPLTVAELREQGVHALYLRQIKGIIEREFVEAKNGKPSDAQIFAEKFLHDDGARFFYLRVHKQVVAFFGASDMGEGMMHYLDWLGAAKRDKEDPSVIAAAGIAQALLRSGMRKLREDREINMRTAYAVAKPHVAMEMCIESMGAFGIGVTPPGECKDTYIRMVMHEDERPSLGKSLEETEVRRVIEACPAPNVLHPLKVEWQGKEHELLVCAVAFDGLNPRDDIQPGTDEAFIYDTIHALCQDGAYVVSRFFQKREEPKAEASAPADGVQVAKSKRRTYYCVLEKRLPLWDDEDDRRMRSVIDQNVGKH